MSGKIEQSIPSTAILIEYFFSVDLPIAKAAKA